MYKWVGVPFVGWSASISTYYQEMDGKRWGHARGRCREDVWWVPFFKWTIKVEGRGKSYRELVDAPKYLKNLDWIIDEFDASFNDLAIASLRYHMDHSVAYCDPERRARYKDLIERLSERKPRVADTPEKRAIIAAHWDAHGLDGINLAAPDIDAIHDDYWEREKAFHERIQQARHDFVDIMPGLWS
ncbi:hypothetical protein [Nocardia wallacei]|uniref:hypothetical protein n=1 Tax=Nocardia wallacei TaxID=480035 RepID=UPI002454062A|nr:hypothetical protein [Nocardia wallacei]